MTTKGYVTVEFEDWLYHAGHLAEGIEFNKWCGICTWFDRLKDTTKDLIPKPVKVAQGRSKEATERRNRKKREQRSQKHANGDRDTTSILNGAE